MADSSSRRPWVVLVLALAVVAAALFASLGGADGEPEAGGSSAAPSADPSPEPAPPTPDEFCASFRTFADANNTVVAAPTSASGQALVEASRTLLEMTTPLGMTDGARASLDQLVAGSLPQVEGVPGVVVDTSPDPARTAEPDQAALDEYLQLTCPA